jgi:hypothetical protein
MEFALIEDTVVPVFFAAFAIMRNGPAHQVPFVAAVRVKSRFESAKKSANEPALFRPKSAVNRHYAELPETVHIFKARIS